MTVIMLKSPSKLQQDLSVTYKYYYYLLQSSLSLSICSYNAN